MSVWSSLHGQIRKEFIVWLKCFDRKEIICRENLEEVVSIRPSEAGKVLQKNCYWNQDKKKKKKAGQYRI